MTDTDSFDWADRCFEKATGLTDNPQLRAISRYSLDSGALPG